MAVTLPVALAIILWWKQGRVTWSDAWRIAPFFLIALGISLADLQYYQSAREFAFDYGIAERVLIAARALWFYPGKLVWPTELAVFYPLWDVDSADLLAWAYVIAALAVAMLLWFGRHRLGRGPLAGAMFFAVTLSPVLGFVDFGYMAHSFVAERYAYLAGIGIMAIIIGAAAHGTSALPDLPRTVTSGVLIAILAVFGKLSWDQAGIYRDKITFYNHILSVNPEALMYGNLARALNDAGRSSEALAASRIAVERHPDLVGAHNIHGIVLFSLNRLDEAAESFQRVLELDANHRHAPRNMAEIRMRQSRFIEAARWYRKALDNDPESAPAHAGLGEAQFHLGQHQRAVESLERAIDLRPDTATVGLLHLLAEALRKLERNEEAIERYHEVLEARPGVLVRPGGDRLRAD